MVKPRSKLSKVISELTIYCDFGYTLSFTNKKDLLEWTRSIVRA